MIWCFGVLVWWCFGCVFGVVVEGLSSSCLGTCGLPFGVETTVELIKGRQPGGGVEEWIGGCGVFGLGLGCFGWLVGRFLGFLVVAFWGFCFGYLAYWSLENWDRGFGLEALIFLSFSFWLLVSLNND